MVKNTKQLKGTGKSETQKSVQIKIPQKNRRLKPIENEEWKFVVDTNNKYAISNYGRVKSYAIFKEGKIMKSNDIRGLSIIVIKINGNNRTKLIHRLVAEHFVPKENELQTKVMHIDGIKKNNHYKNLIWLTTEEFNKIISERNKKRIGTRASMITNSNLKESDIVLLKQMLNKGVKGNIIAKLFRISEMQVTRIKRGENWKDVKVP